MEAASQAPEIARRGVDGLGDFTVDRRLLFVSAFGILIGVVCALIAVALLSLIGFFTNLFFYGRFAFTFVSPAENQLGPYVIAIPVMGGLMVGLLARYGSERIRGHGIPEAIEAILINRSRIEPKVTILKPLATAISIGSGGPFGAEGPIIMTGGAFGSVLAQFLRLSAMERKTLLVAGAAAGMAATFNTPVAAVLLAVELLLFEWKPRSLIPVGLASITATVLRGVLLGTNPVFPVGLTPIPTPLVVVSAVAVGIIAGGVSTLLTWGVYESEDAFRKLPIHWMWWPALGGLMIGVGGVVAPRSLGVGYDTIDALLLAHLAVGTVAVLLLVKSTVWAFSLGSGTSGGVLAPLMLMGGSLGALESLVLPSGNPTLWVLVSMGATIGGTMRSPFTGVVFTLELTHDVNAMLPLLTAALAADLFTVFSMKRSILTEKVARRGVHVAREYSVDPLEQMRVGTVMRKDFAAVRANLPVKDLVSGFVEAGGRSVGYPVVDDAGSLRAFVTRDVIFSCIAKRGYEGLLVLDIVSAPLVVVFPNEPVRTAADKMASSGLESIPVVDPSNPQKVVGLFSREDIFRARVLWSEEERLREKRLSLPKWSVRRGARHAAGRLRQKLSRRLGGSADRTNDL